MAKTPAEWIAWLVASCTRAGLSAPNAEECVNEVLQRYRLEAGYTPAEIARTLGVCESTVRAYRRDMKAKFVKYFGYDPRIWGDCVVNYSGSVETDFPKACEEVADEETTAEDTGNHGVGVSDCEPISDWSLSIFGADVNVRGNFAICDCSK